MPKHRTHHSSHRRERERRAAREQWRYSDPNHGIDLTEIRRSHHTPRRSELRPRSRRDDSSDEYERVSCCVVM